MEEQAEYKKNKGLSMTRIDTDQHKKLKTLSRKFELSQTEFLNFAVDYFSQTGINPKEKIYSPREEISKLEKRVNQVIKFLNVFQRDQAKPVFDELTKLYLTFKKIIPYLSTKSDWSEWRETWNTYTKSIKSRFDNLDTEIKIINDQLTSIQEEQSKQDEKLNLILGYISGNKDIKRKVESQYK